MPETSKDTASTRSHTRFVRSYLTASSLVSLVDFIFGAMYVALLIERSVDPVVIGVIFAVTNLIQMAMEIPSGILADRFGQRLLTALGTAFWGLGLTVFALTETVSWNITGLCVWAIGMALYSGAPISLVVNRAKSLGLEREVPKLVRMTHIWRWVASAAGALLSITLIGSLSPQVLIALGGVALIAGALVIQLSWPEFRTHGNPKTGRTASVRVIISAWTEHRQLLITSCIALAPFTLMILSWQPVAQELGGLAIESLGIPLLIFSLAAAFGAYLLKHIPILASKAAVLAAATGIAASIVVATLLTGWPVLAWYAVAEIFAGIALAGVATMQHSAFPDEGRSTLLSVFSAVTASISALVSFCFGWLWQERQLEGALMVSGASIAMIAIIYLIIILVHHGRNKTKSTVQP